MHVAFSSPHILITTFGLFDVHNHIHSSWGNMAERTSCILENLFSLAQVQIPKTNLRRGLYMDSTMEVKTLRLSSTAWRSQYMFFKRIGVYLV